MDSKFADIPFTAIFDNFGSVLNLQYVLTAHGFRLTKDFLHLRIHLDHEILFCRNFGVSCINLSFYPLGKLVFENCSTDVGDPLLWSFGEFYVRFRQIGVDLGMVLVEKLPDLFDSKTIITKITIKRIKL